MSKIAVAIFTLRLTQRTSVVTGIYRKRGKICWVKLLCFRGFQEHYKSFTVNIHFIIQASNNGIVLEL